MPRSHLPARPLAVALSLALAACARGDVLVLTSGRILRGEVQERTHREVVLRTEVDGEWEDLRFDLDDVEDLFEEEGDQAADAPRPAPAPSKAPAPPPHGAPPVVVIPLRGHVGGLIDGAAAGTFDAELVARFLDEAEAAGAAACVLAIDSPGGYLAEMESICQVIIERSRRLRIVAWPAEALSAAAVIALCCPEMIVRPGARVGAAVMVEDAPDGPTAVDAKRASPHHARQRQFMAASGRPHELLAAMTIQPAQLWWSAAGGFSAEAAGGAEHVDGETTVLTMTGADAVRWGVAAGAADDARALPALLGLARQTPIVDYREQVERHVAQVDERVRGVLAQFRSYFHSLGAMHDALGHLERAAAAGDAAREQELRAEVRRQLVRARTAGRAIRREDRRLLARRTELPDGLIAQFDRDEQELKRIGRLAGTARPAEARHAVAAILEQWRALMSF